MMKDSMDDLSGLNPQPEPQATPDTDFYNALGAGFGLEPTKSVPSKAPGPTEGYIPMYPTGASSPEDIHWGVPADKLKEAHKAGLELAVPLQRQGEDKTWVPLSKFKGHESDFIGAGYTVDPNYQPLATAAARFLPGMTFNTLDAALPALYASVDKFYGPGGSDRDWHDLYTKHRQGMLAGKEIGEEMNPGSALGGELAGGLPSAVGTGGAKWWAQGALGGLSGASEGTLKGGSATEVGKSAALGGVLGGALAKGSDLLGSGFRYLQGKGWLPMSTDTAMKEQARSVTNASAGEDESFESAAQRVAAAIRTGMQSPVAGVQRTTAEAAGPGLPAIAQAQNITASQAGTPAAVQLASQGSKNQQALSEAMRGANVTEDALAAAKAARGASADVNYPASKIPNSVGGQELGDILRAHAEIESNPLLTGAVQSANEVNQASRTSYADAANGGMKAYDNLKQAIGTAIREERDPNRQRLMGDAQNKLIDALDAASPTYKAARQAFANDSTAMAMSQAQANVVKKSAPLGEPVNLKKLQAVREANVGSVAGSKSEIIRSPNEQYLTPDVKQLFDNVESELTRQRDVARLGVAGGGSKTAQNESAPFKKLISALGIFGVGGELGEHLVLAKHIIGGLNTPAEQHAALRLFTEPEKAAEIFSTLNAHQIGNVRQAATGLTQATARTVQPTVGHDNDLEGLMF